MRTQVTRPSWNQKSRGVSYQYRPKESQHHKTGRKNFPSHTQNNRRRIPNRNHTQSPFETRRHDTFRPKFREYRRHNLTGLIDIFGDYENDGIERHDECFGKRVYSIDYLMSLRRIPEHQNYDQLLPKQIQRRKSVKQYQEGSQSFGAYVRELHRHRPVEEEKIQLQPPVLGRKKPMVKHVRHVRSDRPTKPPLRHEHAKMSFDEIETKVETVVLEKEEIAVEEVMEMPEEMKVVEVEEVVLPEVKIESPVIEEVKEMEKKKKKTKKVTKKKKKRKKQKVVETTKDESFSFSLLIWVLMFVGVVSMIVIGMKSSESYVSSRGDADWVSAVSSRKTTISDSFGSVEIPSVKMQNNGLADYDFVRPLDRPSFPDWTSRFVPA